MDIKQFGENLIEKMKNKLPEEYDKEELKLVEVAKNNDTISYGVFAPVNETIATPLVYIEPAFEKYLKGASIDKLAEEVADVCLANRNEDIEKEVKDVTNYESVKDKLQVRIYDAEMNKERLKDKVHYIDGDFAVCYAVNLSEENGISSFLVTNELLNAWDIEPDELHEDALTADLKRGVMLNTLEDTVLYTMGIIDEPKNYFINDGKSIDPIYVLKNPSGAYGSGLIENELVRERIAEVLDGNFYVLPSSLHEVIIVPELGADIKALNEMVKDVNSNVVENSDVLSDKVQFCNAITLKLENAELHEFKAKEIKDEFLM